MPHLDDYRAKRDFTRTNEPRPEHGPRTQAGGAPRFVIQKHAARRLHYDLRLEHGGVLHSWAVPRGPSLNPSERRLAVPTEPHPLDYADFEGVIPAGQYGAGKVIVWDRGRWQPTGDVQEDLRRGRLRFTLFGEKLRGDWNLIRTRDDRWLLIKARDEFARASDTKADAAHGSIVDARPDSVLSGRTLEELEADPAPARIKPGELPGARRVQTLPPDFSLQLARASAEAPEGASWLHEIKLDGYRMLVHVEGERARLETRGGIDRSAAAPGLLRLFTDAGLGLSVFDGELCVLERATGKTSFAALQQALGEGREERLVYFAFDLPFYAGWDLRRAPLRERKQLLREVITSRLAPSAALRYCEHLLGAGPEIFHHACELGLEGIVSKRADAPYVSERAASWRKIKCPRRSVFVVGGHTASSSASRPFASLLLGEYDDEGRLRYRGKVGSGFSQRQLAELEARLTPLERATPAFADPPRGARLRGITWVEPELRVEVVYSEQTEAGNLRHPHFQALVEPDAPPPAAAQPHPRAPLVELTPTEPKPEPEPGKGPPQQLRLTHPDKLLAEDPPVTKRQLAEYMMQVSDWLLPHATNRLLTLLRCPDGISGACFYQRHRMQGAPEAIRSMPVDEREGQSQLYTFIDDPLGLVALVQISAIELHLWGSRREQLDRPDRLVFDLDPDAGLDHARVIEAALELRDRLARLDLQSFVKTTGGKGLHVVVPIEPQHDFTHCKQFARALAKRMVEASPTRYTIASAKAQRHGKIFLDILRNDRGATSVAPYSPRARPGLPVSTPLAWEELDPSLRSDAFTIATIGERLRALTHDPWAELLELRQPLPPNEELAPSASPSKSSA